MLTIEELLLHLFEQKTPLPDDMSVGHALKLKFFLHCLQFLTSILFF